ncbi:Ribosomal large subunit pseudouridine synthase D [Candidatus Hepatincola sp. Av]
MASVKVQPTLEPIIKLKVSSTDNGNRLDVFIAKNVPALSRAKVQKLIESNYIEVLHGAETVLPKSDYKVKADDVIILHETNITAELDLVATPMPIQILYEDDKLLLINKPWGLVVHPGAGNVTNTLVNGLIYKYGKGLSGVNGEFRAGIVHRLDKDTSGILVVAKDDATHNFLAKQFQEHSIVRKYRALVWGVPKAFGEITTHITRNESNRQKMVTHSSKGKIATTMYKVIESYGNYFSLIDVSLKTGRTHQIRVHMAALGHAVVGDPLYGKKHKVVNLPPLILNLINGLSHQALHAYKLGFIHPNGQYLQVEEPEPADLQIVYKELFSHYINLVKSKVMIEEKNG